MEDGGSILAVLLNQCLFSETLVAEFPNNLNTAKLNGKNTWDISVSKLLNKRESEAERESERNTNREMERKTHSQADKEKFLELFPLNFSNLQGKESFYQIITNKGEVERKLNKLRAVETVTC